MFRPFLVCIVSTIVVVGAARAPALDVDCRLSVILSNYQTGEDLQMASLVTRSIYQQIRESDRDAPMIFGVPTGKNYVEFRRWISLVNAEQPASAIGGQGYQVAMTNCADVASTQ